MQQISTDKSQRLFVDRDKSLRGLVKLPRSYTNLPILLIHRIALFDSTTRISIFENEIFLRTFPSLTIEKFICMVSSSSFFFFFWIIGNCLFNYSFEMFEYPRCCKHCMDIIQLSKIKRHMTINYTFIRNWNTQRF